MIGPLVDGFEWAVPAGSQEWGIRRTGGWRMLCGQRYSAGRRGTEFCPVVQPVTPNPQCEACVAKYGELA